MLPKHLVYVGTNVAPHSETVRASYVCPYFKKAHVLNGYLQQRKRTASTVAEVSTISIALLSPNNTFTTSTTNGVPILKSFSTGNAVLTNDIRQSTFPIVLLPGEQINILSLDNNADGTMDYVGSVIIYEVDDV